MKQTPTLLDIAAEEKRKKIQDSFLPEWNEEQFITTQKGIAAHFSGKPMETAHGNYPAMYLGWIAIGDRIGLAYTSSGLYAGYWVCNTDVYNPKYLGYRYVGFALSSDGKGYAILWDKDENEIIIPL